MRGKALSPAAYNLTIGAVLAEGMIATVAEIMLLREIIPTSGVALILVIAAYFGLSLLGYSIAMKSDNTFMSLIGFNVEVFAVSLLLSTITFVAETALRAAGMTLIVTILMTLASCAFPAFFNKIAGALSVALTILIIVEVVMLLFTGGWPEIIDVVGAALFCGFIAVDWARAHNKDYIQTADSAVDACCDIYLDIVNVFLYVYELLKSKD